MVRRFITLAPALSVGMLSTACPPSLNQTASIVTSAQVLAVRADPAEAPAMPPTQVTFTALLAGPKGDEQDARIGWAFCNARKPLAELGPVSPLCLQGAGPAGELTPFGAGLQATATIPDVACRQFGPAVPVAMMGQPPGRPVDSDTTGGYYQPVQILASTADGDSLAIFRSRISCGLAGGTGDQETEFGQRYHVNTNPDVSALSIGGTTLLVPHTSPAPAGAKVGMPATNSVRAGQRLPLQVSWANCPLTDVCGDGVCGADETQASCPADCRSPKGCAGAERYLSFDLIGKTLGDQREGITASWFATGGTFDSDTTGRDSADIATASDNGWRAPSLPLQQNPVIMWIVLHDDRGGVGWAEYAFMVQ